jgi:carotenoid cleavage dioxygenase-like enzyme
MEGSLPPDLQGTLFRVGPGPGAAERGRGDHDGDAGDDEGVGAARPDTVRRRGALHAVELRDGKAVSYLRRDSEADAGVFWHAGSVLALPEVGLPSRYSRFLEPQEFAGGLTVPIASHVPLVASDGSRVLFAVDDGAGGSRDGGVDEAEGTFLRIGEWDASGELRTAQSVQLDRATWQHDIGVTAQHVVFIESPTTRIAGADNSAVPFGWVPGAECWIGVVSRGGNGTDVRWFGLGPCLVTHVLGAYEEDETSVPAGRASGGAAGAIVLYVCRYAAPEPGQPVDLSTSVVGPAGIGLTTIGGGLGVLERWRIVGADVEREVADERYVEYPRIDATCAGEKFRYGYCVEMDWGGSAGDALRSPSPGGRDVDAHPAGLLKFDLDLSSAVAWNPGPGCTPSEPVFVRAADGHGDDEGWLVTVVDDANRGASDLYVLDASSMARRRPEAIIHLPERLPPRSHGEWVPADRYR